MVSLPAGSSTVVVRRLTPRDLGPLQALVDEAVAGGAFAGSSDPSGGAIGFLAKLAPRHKAIALDDDRLVGLISPEVKAIYVVPDRRREGIGRRLVEEAVVIERERRRPNVLLGTLPDDEPARAFLRATGFAYHSSLWDMQLAPDIDVPAPVWPAGVVGRPVDFVGDMDAFIQLFNATFADHATPLVIDRTVWQGDDREFVEPDDVLVLHERDDPKRLIAFCWTDPARRPTDPPHAEIWTVGVAPAHRGRGLGRQLVRWGVQRLRAVRDLPVILSVNGHNERALGLYEHEGFHRTSTRERWARPAG
jgi:mycothiol synthase